MKKFSYLLSALFLTLGMGASAQSFSPGDDLGEIPAADKPVMLRTANTETATGSKVYYAGEQGMVADYSDACVFYFVPTGQSDSQGAPIYRLKSHATGKFLAKPELDEDVADSYVAGEGVTFTDVEEDAFTFTALNAVSFDAPDEPADPRSAAQHSRGEGQDPQYKQELNGMEFVFCSSPFFKKSNGEKPIYLGVTQGAIMLSVWTDTDAWTVVAADNMSAVDYLRYSLAKFFPNGVDENSFPVGNNPGQFRQADYDKAYSLYETIYTGMNEEGLTEDKAKELSQQLIDGYKELMASRIHFTTGYYFMNNYRDKTKAVFDDSTQAKLENYTVKEDEMPSADNAKFIWYLEFSNDTTATIKNFYTGRYLINSETKTADGGNEILTGAAAEPWHLYESVSASIQNTFIVCKSFNLESKDVNTIKIMLNTKNSNNTICEWNDLGDNGSHWTFSKLSDEAVAALDLGKIKEEERQGETNAELQAVYDKAYNAYQNAIKFAEVSGNDINNGKFDVAGGLLTDVSQLSSNATEPSEGSLDATIDGDLSNFFHTEWSAHNADGPHYFQMALNEPVQNIAIKVAKRNGVNPDRNLKSVIIYGSNTPEDAESWVRQDSVTVSFDYQGTVGEEVKKNFVALFGVKMDQAYSNVRLEIASTIAGGTTADMNGVEQVFSYFSEIQAYNAEKSEASSPELKKVPQEVKDALTTQLAAAKAELAAEKATKATIDALQAAYDRFNDVLPNPELITEATKKLRDYIENLPFSEGGEPKIGYFTQDGIDGITAKLDEFDSQVSDPEASAKLLVADIKKIVADVDGLRADVDRKMGLPTAGTFYIIKGATTTATAGSGMGAPVYAQGSSLSAGVRFMPTRREAGYENQDSVDVSQGDRYNYVWQVESVDKDARTITLRNAFSGLYLGDATAQSGAVKMSKTPHAIRLQSAADNSTGAVNLQLGHIVKADSTLGDALYANTQSGGALVGYTSNAAKLDNSAFTFEVLEELGGNDHIAVKKGELQIVTLPYAIESIESFGKAYTVKGLNREDKTLEIDEIDGAIEAGTPFIYFADADETELNVALTTSEMPEFATAPNNTVPGLVGTLDADSVGVLPAMFFKKIDASDGYKFINRLDPYEKTSAMVAANSGFFYMVPETTEKGDASVKIQEKFITGIEQVVAGKKAAVKGVFDLQGRRVASPVKGLYIIDGKKVLVK